MDSQPKFPPREGDLSREELIKLANQAVEDSAVPVDVYFKYTCIHCGHRCMLSEPNLLYDNGECNQCGRITEIKVGGFSLHYQFGLVKQQKLN